MVALREGSSPMTSLDAETDNKHIILIIKRGLVLKLVVALLPAGELISEQCCAGLRGWVTEQGFACHARLGGGKRPYQVVNMPFYLFGRVFPSRF